MPNLESLCRIIEIIITVSTVIQLMGGKLVMAGLSRGGSAAEPPRTDEKSAP